jgi:pimeloyl-ACP methyl ester carboxylesterase
MKYIVKVLNEQSKKRILFLNPISATTDYWTQNLKIQNRFENYELIFLDYPGYSTVAFTPIDNLQNLANEITNDLNELSVKETVVIGFSYGGNVAIHLSLFFKFEKMVLIGTNPYMLENEMRFYEYLENDLNKNGLYAFSSSLLNFCYNEIEKANNPFLHLTLYSSLKLNVDPLGLKQQLLHLRKNTLNYAQINSIKPLLIFGKNDITLFEDTQDRYAFLFKEFTYQEFENSGHFILDYNPNALQTIIDYIN